LSFRSLVHRRSSPPTTTTPQKPKANASDDRPPGLEREDSWLYSVVRGFLGVLSDPMGALGAFDAEMLGGTPDDDYSVMEAGGCSEEPHQVRVGCERRLRSWSSKDA
jgi:hypothetical protein